jgi:hypothetical protein
MNAPGMNHPIPRDSNGDLACLATVAHAASRVAAVPAGAGAGAVPAAAAVVSAGAAAGAGAVLDAGAAAAASAIAMMKQPMRSGWCYKSMIEMQPGGSRACDFVALLQYKFKHMAILKTNTLQSAVYQQNSSDARVANINASLSAIYHILIQYPAVFMAYPEDTYSR